MYGIPVRVQQGKRKHETKESKRPSKDKIEESRERNSLTRLIVSIKSLKSKRKETEFRSQTKEETGKNNKNIRGAVSESHRKTKVR